MESAKILKKQSSSLQSIEALKSKMKLICAEKIHIITKSDILYLKSDSNYCEVVMTDGRRIMCSQTLKSLYSRLHPSQFFRSHQSYAFNIKYLESVHSSVSELTLTGNVVLPISRRTRADLKRKLEIWFD